MLRVPSAAWPAGPCPAILLSAVLRGGKRQFGGKVAYAGSIRHQDPLLCCHCALARHLIKHFTMDQAPCPDPCNPDEWRHTPLWTGYSVDESISYTQHAEALKGYLEAAGIIIAKVTHAFRMYKARDLDGQGVDDGVSGWAAGPGLLARDLCQGASFSLLAQITTFRAHLRFHQMQCRRELAMTDVACRCAACTC